MNSSNIIGRWAILLLAEVLNLSASVAERILFGQPRWLAQLRLLEANLREPSQTPVGDSEDESEDPVPDATRQLLESYAILNRALKDIEARGLALDGALIERMKNEWNPASIVGYLQTCDTQLKEGIGKTLRAAAEAIGAEPTAVAGCDNTQQQGQTPLSKAQSKPVAASKPKSSPERPKDLVS